MAILPQSCTLDHSEKMISSLRLLLHSLASRQCHADLHLTGSSAMLSEPTTVWLTAICQYKVMMAKHKACPAFNMVVIITLVFLFFFKLSL